MRRVVRRKAVQSRDFGRGGVRELWDLLTYIIKIKKEHYVVLKNTFHKGELGFWFETSLNDI